MHCKISSPQHPYACPKQRDRRSHTLSVVLQRERRADDGRLVVELSESVSAALEGARAGDRPNTYAVRFTTEATVARSAGGAVEIPIQGARAGDRPNTYAVRFTTEATVARSAGGAVEIPIQGARVVPGPGYVQLVAGATDAASSLVEPGAAVYAVLSGTFDRLPSLP